MYNNIKFSTITDVYVYIRVCINVYNCLKIISLISLRQDLNMDLLFLLYNVSPAVHGMTNILAWLKIYASDYECYE